ncbi:MAG: hypothetical protein IJX90_01730 [Blautia sp.]|nr:hypothetical protein [Blautia sp.]
MAGTAHNQKELLRLIENANPDLVIMDRFVSWLDSRGQKFPGLFRSLKPVDYRIRLPRSQIRDQSIERKVTRYILDTGVPAHVKGYLYLRDAIIMAAFDETLLDSMTKLLYPAVAERHKTTGPRVERGIRHAIELGWDDGEGEDMKKVFERTGENPSKPTNSEYIALLADRIRLEGKIRPRIRPGRQK